MIFFFFFFFLVFEYEDLKDRYIGNGEKDSKWGFGKGGREWLGIREVYRITFMIFCEIFY